MRVNVGGYEGSDGGSVGGRTGWFGQEFGEVRKVSLLSGLWFCFSMPRNAELSRG